MLNQDRDFTEIPRKWTAVQVDETEHCGEEFVSRCGGKVYQVYLFDANERTYCCSLTPSYALYPVEMVAGKYSEEETTREALHSELLEAMHCAETVFYFSCSDIDRLPETSKAVLTGLEGDPSGDDALECYQSCPDF